MSIWTSSWGSPFAFDEAAVRVLQQVSWPEPLFAFDRASIRTFDTEGRLHVALTPISKATVNPYLGREIPNWQKLGLDPGAVYQMLRDPGELQKAAGTFNKLPVLSKHMPIDSVNYAPELVIGATGEQAAFRDPYLFNTLVIWAQPAIDDIDDGAKQQISCAYRYTPDMRPGVFRGARYDGVMRSLIGNHVAVVKQGRAGPDVIIGDAQPEEINMANSAAASLVKGAIFTFLQPRLAMDQTLDYNALVAGITDANLKTQVPALRKRIERAVAGKLAMDSRVDGLATLLDALGSGGLVGPAGAPKAETGGDLAPGDPAKAAATGEAGDAGDPPVDPAAGGGAPPSSPDAGAGGAPPDGGAGGGGDPISAIKAFLASKLQPEDMQHLEGLIAAASEDAGGGEGGGDPAAGGGMPEAGKTFGAGGGSAPPKPPAPKAPAAPAGGGGGAPAPKAPDDKKPTVAGDRKGAASLIAGDSNETIVAKAREEIRAQFKGANEALRIVRPYVGDLNGLTFDSAEEVFRAALVAKGIDKTRLAKVQGAEALRILLEAQPKGGRTSFAPPAMDGAPSKKEGFDDRYPNAKRIGIA